MAEQLQVIITGKDGVSRVFKDISQSADKMGDSIERSGRDANKATREFDRSAASTRTMGDRFKSATDVIDGMGFALTAVGAALTVAGNKAMQQERQIIGLRAAYGDAADEMLAFAEELDKVTIFDDDDIRAGERYFASLRNNYDLSIQQIQDLMRTTADLASASGTSFEDASSRVTAAIRGEGEAAEYLGLTMNQQSIDRENLTLTMSNQEAAQFRLNALNQQAAVYVGTAAELQASSAGTMADMTDRTNDAAAAVGAFIGPFGSMVSGLGLGLVGVTSMVGGLGRMTSAMRTSTIAARAMTFALNPLTLILGSVALGVGVLIHEHQKQAQEVERATESYEGLLAVLEDLRLSGLNTEEFEDYASALRDIYTLADEFEQPAFDEFIDATGLDPTKAGNDFLEFMRQYDVTANEFNAANDKFIAGITDARVNTDLFLAYIDDLIAKMQESEFDDFGPDWFFNQLANVDLSEFRNIAGAVDDTASSVTHLKQGADALVDTYTRLKATEGELLEIQQERSAHDEIAATHAEESAQAQTTWYEETRAQQDAAREEDRQRHEERKAQFNDLREMHDAEIESILAIAAAAVQAQVDFIAAGTALAGWDDALSQLNLAGFGTDAMIMADNLGQATTALDNTFRIIVGNTDAIGQQVQGVEDWITALGESNDVLTEQAVITVANANVQEDLLSIQAQQAPLVAEQTVRTAAYVDELEKMPSAQQAIALGWADANTAAKANEAITIAAAAANGEWGASGEEAARQWIEAAVGVNPILFDMLENIGLITGTPHDFTINFDGAASAKSDIDLLNESVRMLTDQLDDGEINGSIGFQVTGKGDVDLLTGSIEEALAYDGENAHITATGDGSHATNAIATVADALRNLDGDSATVSAYLSDFASAGINGIRNALAGLDGRSATSYVNTVHRTFYEGVGGSPFMHGGIPEFADGGVTARMGEAGPELLHFAGGGTAIAPYDGLYTVPPMTYVSPAPASASTGGRGGDIVINVNGPVFGIDDLTAQVMDRMVPALEQADRMHRRGLGA